MADDDLHSIAREPNEVVRTERLTHHIQRIREDQHAMRAAIERMSEALTRLALSLMPSCAQAGTWFNDASVYAGLDWTKKLSPQCKPDSVDDRGTSNLGAKLNLWQSDSKRVRVNTKYTHHSCALGPGAKAYDAVGVELGWKVWER